MCEWPAACVSVSVSVPSTRDSICLLASVCGHMMCENVRCDVVRANMQWRDVKLGWQGRHTGSGETLLPHPSTQDLSPFSPSQIRQPMPLPQAAVQQEEAVTDLGTLSLVEWRAADG